MEGNVERERKWESKRENGSEGLREGKRKREGGSERAESKE